MLKSRNLSSHIYLEPVAEELLADIRKVYYPLFVELKTVLTAMETR
jgi:hypothetical protein